MTDEEAQYITIGRMWECTQCDTEGRYGKLGIIVHEIFTHILGDVDD